MTFGLVYRSPEWNSQSIEDLIYLVNDTNHPIIMVRDYNLPSIDWEQCVATGSKAAQFLEACKEADMELLLMFLTHVRGNVYRPTFPIE